MKRSRRGKTRAAQGSAGFVRTHKNLVATVGSLLFVVLVWQVSYPAGKALPFAHLDGVAVGGQSREKIARFVSATYKDVPLTLTYSEKQYKGTTAQRGYSP